MRNPDASPNNDRPYVAAMLSTIRLFSVIAESIITYSPRSPHENDRPDGTKEYPYV